MTREFELKVATREKTPLLVGIVGPSASGKTYSALRLAKGMQVVTGGDIAFIDTEARRALAYSELFKFKHLAFGAPFGPMEYLDALTFCLKSGAKTIVVDSMSHEHEGPGGVLEMHEAELAKLGGNLSQSIRAWGKPKRERRQLINAILQMECNFVFCWRAKRKLKIVKGKEPEQLGWMPIAGEEFVYEMSAKFLLLPGANGFPTFASEFEGEREAIKLPIQFQPMFPDAKPLQLSEAIGTAMAKWSEGSGVVTMTRDQLVTSAAACSDPATLAMLRRAAAISGLAKDDADLVRDAFKATAARIKAANEKPAAPPPPPDDPSGTPIELGARQPGDDDDKAAA